ncbi:MAG: tetratricopeptide repeat protein [Hyphomonadaceae bacterium]
MTKPGQAARNFASVLALGGLAATGLSACTTAPSPQETALVETMGAQTIIPATRAERDAADQADLLTQATFWGNEYEKNPNDYEASLKFTRILRQIGSASRGVEVAVSALNLRPGDVDLTIALAQAALEAGQPETSVSYLARAEANGLSNWRFLSTAGVVLDQLGRHAEARGYYEKALAVSPDNPAVMTNLGLSYALEGKPEIAETTLRKAAALPGADDRVRQNLALILGVQGKFDEASKAVEGAPVSLADSNREYFKALLTPARSWEALRGATN